MIPAIFAALGQREAASNGADIDATRLSYKRQAAAVIGIAGAVGAFGGFLIQVAFRQASLPVVTAMAKATKTIHNKAELGAAKAHIAAAHSTWSISALWIFLASYVLLAAVAWFFYVRRSLMVRRFPSLAAATV